jgi:predicted AlkP superfamily pyrophosphatase or phosphodiesterase/heat shock protein HslJ
VPHIRTLAARGVTAEGLIPPFPPKTFPSHYTLVTGLRPDRHGIVSNTMVEPGVPDRFTMSAPTAKDPRWWGGEPLWVTAVRQGHVSASMFWPGSEVPIGGVHPTYWKSYEDRFPNADRVRQVLEWLALPPAERPSFVTLYFSDVDAAGHAYGPDSPEVLDAASRLDALLGELVAGIGRLDLVDRTTIVLVSDHGMSQLDWDRTIFLDDYVDLSSVEVVEWSPVLGIIPSGTSIDAVYEQLKNRHPALAVYRRDEIPGTLHYRDNPRIPPIVGIADEGWTIMTRDRFAVERASGRPPGGGHGYDPSHPSMHGLFVAAGPRLASGARVPAFESVHLYEFMCAILGLIPSDNDGDPAATRAFFAGDRAQPTAAGSAPILFRATGSEPGWLLEIRATETTLLADYGERRLTVPTPVPESIPGGRRYAAQGLSARILDTLCVDGMSGRPNPQTVSVVFDGRELNGCGGDPADLLQGGEWTVDDVGGAPLASPPYPTLRFGADGRVSGSTSCNTFTGTFTITGEGVSLSKLASTRKACLPGLMDRERAFLEVLARVHRFDIGPGGMLVLEAGDDRLTARR